MRHLKLVIGVFSFAFLAACSNEQANNSEDMTMDTLGNTQVPVSSSQISRTDNENYNTKSTDNSTGSSSSSASPTENYNTGSTVNSGGTSSSASSTQNYNTGSTVKSGGTTPSSSTLNNSTADSKPTISSAKRGVRKTGEYNSNEVTPPPPNIDRLKKQPAHTYGDTANRRDGLNGVR